MNSDNQITSIPLSYFYSKESGIAHPMISIPLKCVENCDNDGKCINAKVIFRSIEELCDPNNKSSEHTFACIEYTFTGKCGLVKCKTCDSTERQWVLNSNSGFCNKCLLLL